MLRLFLQFGDEIALAQLVRHVLLRSMVSIAPVPGPAALMHIKAVAPPLMNNAPSN
jgi:hypothetical protein